jgi:hypothetical protein
MLRLQPTALAAAMLLALATGAASAQPAPAGYNTFNSGNDLLENCNHRGSGDYDSGACTGYIVGVVDTLAFIPGSGFCMPLHVTKGQVADIVIKRLRDNPADRHYIAAATASAALRDAFPCAAKATS